MAQCQPGFEVIPSDFGNLQQGGLGFLGFGALIGLFSFRILSMLATPVTLEPVQTAYASSSVAS